jgi:D-xylose transport system ATP-binding protein
VTAAAAPAPGTAPAAPILATSGLIKRFGPVTALNGVSFDLRPGECHALCGENGAGKSTLIKTLSGIHPHGSYEGEILVDGQAQSFHGIADAETKGIGVIYQELALVPGLSVAENIALGREPRRGWFIDWLAVNRNARDLLARFNIAIDPEMHVGALGVGHQQLVEIVKALSKDTRVLILDEPTAALAEHEVALLLDILRDLKKRGIALIYISHKLEEVFAISDRITVLRDGQSITTLETAATNRDEVIKHMVGREIGQLFPREAPTPGKPLLEVDNLSADPPSADGLRLRGISLTVRAGEVLGIGGLMGAGRSELLMHIFGAWGRRVSGTVKLDGASHDDADPARSIARGLALVSEDRKRLGLVLEQSISFNLSLSSLRRFAALGGLGFIDQPAEYTANQALFQRLRVKAPDQEAIVGRLSGGNQQKVVIGKALMTGPKVVFLDEPTRGIDVGAKLEVYGFINELTAAGNAVVLVSSELPELMGMSDRILMLGEGRPSRTFARGEWSADVLLAAALSAAQAASERIPTSQQPVTVR